MKNLLQRIREKGTRGVIDAVVFRALRPLHLLRIRHAEEFMDPTDHQYAQIEAELEALGMLSGRYRVDPAALEQFKSQFRFPANYHGGASGGVYDEKILEHFVAWDLLSIGREPIRQPYLDVASASSPWARLLRERGIEAYSIDLAPDPSVARIPYYIAGDATAMQFETGSIGSASLQCAYEMFVGDSDIRLLAELARVLRPGGRAVIAPLYLHTHACFYQSPEYYGRATADPGAKAYVRRRARGVLASRKYSPQSLLERVWRPAQRAGLVPRIVSLHDKRDLGRGIYLRFVLTLDKPDGVIIKEAAR